MVIPLVYQELSVYINISITTYRYGSVWWHLWDVSHLHQEVVRGRWWAVIQLPIPSVAPPTKICWSHSVIWLQCQAHWYLTTIQGKIYGGLSFNSPFPLLLRPQRFVDLIQSFDFSARPTDTSPPFKVRSAINALCHAFIIHMSKCMRFPTMWYVQPAKPQISLRIWAVWSEPLLVAWIFYQCSATDRTSYGVSNLNRRL